MLILLIVASVLVVLVRCSFVGSSLWYQERARADHREWEREYLRQTR